MELHKARLTLKELKRVEGQRKELFLELLEELDGKVMNYRSLATLEKIYDDANTTSSKILEKKIQSLERSY